MNVICKALAEDIKSFDDGRRTINHWITRDTLDRDSELVKAEGCNPAEFMANPVALWAHDRKIPPIGKCVDQSMIIVPGTGIEATTEFAPTPFAQEIFDLYKGGFMKAWSVGFYVTKQGAPELDGQKGATMQEWSLREYSAVPVPSNPDALVKGAEAGSDAASHILRLYYPESKDAVGAARVACDMRRVLGGMESLVNWQRHCKAEGLEFEAEPLAKAYEFFDELGFSPAQSAAQQTNAGATDGDLPEEAVAALLTMVKALREDIDRRPDMATIARRTADAERRALIGGGYPR